MARVAKSRRAEMSERLREAAQEARDTTGSAVDEYFDRLGEMGIAGEGLADPAGEVLGAGTGRAERAIDPAALEDVTWDPERAYPQVVTRSTDPERPRTVASGYDPKNAILRVTFRNGSTYEYLGPSPRQWSAFQRAPSPGRYIDDVLEQYPYRPVEI